MSENTNPIIPTTERVNTHDLKTGDIVWTHGMRVACGARGERYDASTGRTVVWFHGIILNRADVDAAGLISVGFRTDTRFPGYAPGTFWQIQGNELAYWNREV